MRKDDVLVPDNLTTVPCRFASDWLLKNLVTTIQCYPK